MCRASYPFNTNCNVRVGGCACGWCMCEYAYFLYYSELSCNWVFNYIAVGSTTESGGRKHCFIRNNIISYTRHSRCCDIHTAWVTPNCNSGRPTCRGHLPRAAQESNIIRSSAILLCQCDLSYSAAINSRSNWRGF